MEFMDLICDHKRANHLFGLDDEMRDDEEEEEDDDDDDDDEEEIHFDDDDDEETSTLFTGTETDTETQTFTYTYDESATTNTNSHLLFACDPKRGQSYPLLDQNWMTASTNFQKTTPLFEAIDHQHWTSVKSFLTTGQWPVGQTTKLPKIPLREEARQWSVTLDKSGKIINRRLPIHAAITSQAPLDIVQKLVELYPSGVSFADSHGNLPLHLTFLHNSDETVVRCLLQTYPEAVLVKNNCKRGKSGRGLLPMECTCAAGSTITTSKDKNKRKELVQICQDRARKLSLQSVRQEFQQASTPIKGGGGGASVPTATATTAITITTNSARLSSFTKQKLLCNKGNKDKSGAANAAVAVASHDHEKKAKNKQEEQYGLMEVKKELEELRRERSQGSYKKTNKDKTKDSSTAYTKTKDSTAATTKTKESSAVTTKTKDALAVSTKAKNNSVDTTKNNDCSAVASIPSVTRHNSGSQEENRDSPTEEPFADTWTWTSFSNNFQGSFLGIGGDPLKGSSNDSGNALDDNDRLPVIEEVASSEDSNCGNHMSKSGGNINNVSSFGDRWKQSISNKIAVVAGRSFNGGHFFNDNDEITKGESVEVNLNANQSIASSIRSPKKRFSFSNPFRKSKSKCSQGQQTHFNYIDNVTVQSSSTAADRSGVSRDSGPSIVFHESTDAVSVHAATRGTNSVGLSTKATGTATSTPRTSVYQKTPKRFFSKPSTRISWLHRSHKADGTKITGSNVEKDESALSDTEKKNDLASSDTTPEGGGVLSSAWNLDKTSFAQVMSGLILPVTGEAEEDKEEEEVVVVTISMNQDVKNEATISPSTSWRKRRMSLRSKNESNKTKDFHPSAAAEETNNFFKETHPYSFLENAFLIATGNNADATNEETPKPSSSRMHDEPKAVPAIDRVLKKGRRNKKNDSAAKSESYLSEYHEDDDDDDDDSDDEDEDEDEDDDDYGSTSSEGDITSGTNSLSSVSCTSSEQAKLGRQGLEAIKKKNDPKRKWHGSNPSWICSQDGNLSAVLSEASYFKNSKSNHSAKFKSLPKTTACSPKEVKESFPKETRDESDPKETQDLETATARDSFGVFFRKKKSRDNFVKARDSEKPKGFSMHLKHNQVGANRSTEASPRAAIYHYPNAIDTGNCGQSGPRSVSSHPGTVAKTILPRNGDWRSEYQDYLSSTQSVGTKSSNKSSSKQSRGKPKGIESKKKEATGFRGLIKKSRDHRKQRKSKGLGEVEQPTALDDHFRTTGGPFTEEILHDFDSVYPFLLDPALTSVHHHRTESLRKTGFSMEKEVSSSHSTGPVVSESTVENSDEGNVYLVRVRFEN